MSEKLKKLIDESVTVAEGELSEDHTKYYDLGWGQAMDKVREAIDKCFDKLLIDFYTKLVMNKENKTYKRVRLNKTSRLTRGNVQFFREYIKKELKLSEVKNDE